jgi:hypothetical protein
MQPPEPHPNHPAPTHIKVLTASINIIALMIVRDAIALRAATPINAPADDLEAAAKIERELRAMPPPADDKTPALNVRGVPRRGAGASAAGARAGKGAELLSLAQALAERVAPVILHLADPGVLNVFGVTSRWLLDTFSLGTAAGELAGQGVAARVRAWMVH